MGPRLMSVIRRWFCVISRTALRSWAFRVHTTTQLSWVKTAQIPTFIWFTQLAEMTMANLGKDTSATNSHQELTGRCLLSKLRWFRPHVGFITQSLLPPITCCILADLTTMDSWATRIPNREMSQNLFKVGVSDTIQSSSRVVVIITRLFWKQMVKFMHLAVTTRGNSVSR